MTQAIRPRRSSRSAARHPLAAIVDDSKAHPLQDSLAAATIVLGLVAAVTAIWPGLHLVSTVTGLVGIVAGAYGQFISATTGERFVFIIGLGAAAVGFYLGMAWGGFGGMGG